MNPKWSSKFKHKPGKWFFVPTSEAKIEVHKMKKALESRWTPPPYYFHLRQGGHVEALRSHLSHQYFLRIDLKDFFGSVNRTRVTRCLKDKFGYKNARAYANASTVVHPSVPKKTMIPFGFVQSQIVAAFCFSKSALGIYLHKLHQNSDVALSVYVDDIIISTSDIDALDEISTEIEKAASKSNFELNSEKQEGPAAAITAFNIVISKESMFISPIRLDKFKQVLKHTTNEHQIAGIKTYVASVNNSQSLLL
jgi:hypothetical protein